MIDGKMGEIPEILTPTYVSIDPGVTTGVTLWDAEGKPLCYNELDIPNLHKFLDWLEDSDVGLLRRIIVEEYRLYQSKALSQSGSRLETVQVIGMVKRANYSMGRPDVVEVRADNKEIAAKWAGVKWNFKSKAHMPNWMASMLVGYWWLHKEGIIPARVLEEA